MFEGEDKPVFYGVTGLLQQELKEFNWRDGIYERLLLLQ